MQPPEVLVCCYERPVSVVFRVKVADGYLIVIACQEHELEIGTMLDGMRMRGETG